MQDNYFLTLFQRYCNNQLTKDEYMALRQWLAASSENEQLMINFLKLNKREKQWNAFQDIDPQQAWSQILSKRRKQNILITFYRYAAVACIMLALGFGSYFYSRMDTKPSLVELFPNQGASKAILTLSNGEIVDLTGSNVIVDNGAVVGRNVDNLLSYTDSIHKKEENIQFNTITVPRGGEYSLVLSDGTKVWLNAESSLRYPVGFDEKTRKVELIGEAYFEVAKKEVPFIVEAQKNQITVLGTHFNVSAYISEAMVTTLASGSVEVQNHSDKIILQPNQQAEIGMNETQITVRQVNANYYTAWATGLYRFDNTSLEDITAQLSRWYNVKIEYDSPEIKQINFTGTIVRSKSLGFALDLIQRISDVRFKKEEDRIKVYKH
ncbi:iron dicitrate transporter FecR [Bacteroidia bacterium]|nr:iron dicitrate transporter FecR [Bacteroidia bacterium]